MWSFFLDTLRPHPSQLSVKTRNSMNSLLTFVFSHQVLPPNFLVCLARGHIDLERGKKWVYIAAGGDRWKSHRGDKCANVYMAAATITIFVTSRTLYPFPRSYSHLRLAIQGNGEVELVWVSFGAGNADFWRYKFGDHKLGAIVWS